MRWRIYYADGSVFSDTDGTPFDAPTLGVLACATENADIGRVMAYGKPYYLWWEKHQAWWSADQIGMFAYLVEPGPKRVLIGQEVPSRAWDEAIKRILADDYLPPKTAAHPVERELLSEIA